MRYQKLFLGLISFNLIFLSLSYFALTEYLIRKYVLSIDHDYKRSIIYKKGKSKNTIWGDSATETAISKYRNFTNFSEASQCYREIEIKMKNYYSEKSDGGKVILQLSLNGFAPYRNCDKINDRVEDLYLSKDKKTNIYISKNYFRKKSYEYIKNFIRNKFTIKPKTNSEFNEDGSLSYFNIYSPIKKINLSKNNFNNHRYIPRTDFVESGNYTALNEIINYLKNKNIKACLITTPVHNDLFKYVISRDKFKEILDFYKNISKDSGFSYWDMSDYILPDDHFGDISHLNNKGAKTFTKLVEEKCFNQ